MKNDLKLGIFKKFFCFHFLSQNLLIEYVSDTKNFGKKKTFRKMQYGQ